MANEEQLSILKQGVKDWNEWRSKNYEVDIDLSRAIIGSEYLIGVDFSEANLTGVDLRGADLRRAGLNKANLGGARLMQALLVEAHLEHAHLDHADLIEANLRGASLWNADLRDAHLGGADLREAGLGGTNLRKAGLIGTDLSAAVLTQSNLSEAKIQGTIFGNSDLSEVIGLEHVNHLGPSSISTDAFALSKGKIPEAFLRGCGLSDWEIEEVKLYNPNLNNDEVNKILYKIYDLRATQALQISPLFISYSHGDDEFVDKVGDYLAEKGVRYWRDIHDMKAGRMEKQIDRAIRQNPTVLLVLSQNSIKSDWVEHEVRTARELEKDMGRDVLCPIALDDSWKSSPWPKRIMEQIMEYNILDFSTWEDDVKFEGMFRKLIDGLELFYKDKSHGE